MPRGKGATGASCVAAYKLTAEGAQPAGMLVPPRNRLKVLSVVRALPDANGFVTGEPNLMLVSCKSEALFAFGQAMEVLSAVRALPDTNGFVTGEPMSMQVPCTWGFCV